MINGGYRNCSIRPANRRETANGKLFSVEEFVGEISTDGVEWREFVKPLWRRASDGAEAFASWWELARRGGDHAISLLLEVYNRPQ